MEPRSQVDLPDGVGDPFDVFVNGIEQQPGVDFTGSAGRSSSAGSFARKGGSGSGGGSRSSSAVAGTYRRNDTVDVVYTVGVPRRVVASLVAKPSGLPD